MEIFFKSSLSCLNVHQTYHMMSLRLDVVSISHFLGRLEVHCSTKANLPATEQKEEGVER